MTDPNDDCPECGHILDNHVHYCPEDVEDSPCCACSAQPAPLDGLRAAWKRTAKRWRKSARRERDSRWREREALRRVGASIQLAYAVFDHDRGDRTLIFTGSTEALAAPVPPGLDVEDAVDNALLDAASRVMTLCLDHGIRPTEFVAAVRGGAPLPPANPSIIGTDRR